MFSQVFVRVRLCGFCGACRSYWKVFCLIFECLYRVQSLKLLLFWRGDSDSALLKYNSKWAPFLNWLSLRRQANFHVMDGPTVFQGHLERPSPTTSPNQGFESVMAPLTGP